MQHCSYLGYPLYIFFVYRCVSRNTMGESSTTLHLIVRSQWGVSVEPDLLVADFGSNAEFACKIYPKDLDVPSHQSKQLLDISQWSERVDILSISCGDKPIIFSTLQLRLMSKNGERDCLKSTMVIIVTSRLHCSLIF